MSRVESALLELLRAGIWEREPVTDGVFPLTKEEWEKLYLLAKEQTVSGQVFEGVNMLEEQMMPPTALMNRWVVYLDKIELSVRQHNAVQGEVIAWLNQQGIFPIVIKGEGIAQMYKDPLLRPSGDIDLYFRTKEEFDRVFALLEKKGHKPRWEVDGSYIYQWKDISIEHHWEMLDIYNMSLKRTIREWVDGEGFDGIYPTPLTTMLILNTHLLKHLMIHGIGLRQFVDMTYACHCLKGRFSRDEYSRLCKCLNISRWEKELNGILVRYMGVPKEELPSDAIANTLGDRLMEKVLKGGNFGFYGTDRGRQDGHPWKTKWHTMRTLLRAWPVDFKLAPHETFWMTLQLMGGNLTRK